MWHHRSERVVCRLVLERPKPWERRFCGSDETLYKERTCDCKADEQHEWYGTSRFPFCIDSSQIHLQAQSDQIVIRLPVASVCVCLHMLKSIFAVFPGIQRIVLNPKLHVLPTAAP